MKLLFMNGNKLFPQKKNTITQQPVDDSQELKIYQANGRSKAFIIHPA